MLQEYQTVQGDGNEARQAIAAEIDLDGNNLRAMWRWTCYQVTESIPAMWEGRL